MAKRPPRPDPQYEQIRDEAVHIPTGETRYVIDLDEQTVDALANGWCPEALAERMFSLLSWRREAYRQAVPSPAGTKE